MRSAVLLSCLLVVACRTQKQEDTGEPPCVWYHDADGDGFGNADEPEEGDCDATNPSYVKDATDCDDTDAGRNPRALEICDDLDNNCNGEVDEDTEAAPAWYEDQDGDGYGDPATLFHSCVQPEGFGPNGTDCDDADANAFPGATERCDGVDNDCDGTVDDDLTWQWYADVDGDGWGDAAATVESCDPGEGWVEDAGDCDDALSTVNPDAEEVCDGMDQDCDGDVDEGLLGTWYQDLDGDGYGDAATASTACDPGAGWVVDPGDCDDANALVSPDALEACNGLDDDCDALVDDTDGEDVVGRSDWYPDADGDGWGAETGGVTACEAPTGYVLPTGDCDDTDPAYNPGAAESDCTDPTDWNCDGSTGWADNDGDGHAACEECDDADEDNHPGAAESCDGEDNDCDGTVDEADAVDADTFYTDADGDGWGDPTAPTAGCVAPEGTVAEGTDCDDSRADVHPAGAEVCDGADNDCDGSLDEGTLGTWYADADGDGYGDAATATEACVAPAGHVEDASDCDDGDAAVNPAAGERCDGVDNDCDGSVDEADAVDARTWYKDRDEDGYGDEASATTACDAPADHVAEAFDCDDRNATIHPAATETCDGVDQDCDGTIDDDATGATPWYADADGDGLGDAATSTEACSAPAGYVAGAGDCDDANSAVGAGAAETCDGLDNDCDGIVDDGVLLSFQADADGDGYGDAATGVEACSAPTGHVADATDCDDARADVHPGAAETCDGVDQDCDGTLDDGVLSTWYADLDGDGFGDAGAPVTACTAPTGTVADATDCDDLDGRAYPGAGEACDGVDNDCDGATDEAGATGEGTFYADADGDGYGDAASPVTACTAPTGTVTGAGDCDDGRATVHPGAAEACDGMDNDCDGATDETGATGTATWYADADGDGYGDAATAVAACTAPTGFVATATDCDDTAAGTHPGAGETCDGADQDCDGAVDDGATDFSTFHADADGDGYGDAATTTRACTAPSGYVADATDCDDATAGVSPAADEVCNDTDDDCDGSVDEASAVDAGTWYRDRDEDGFGDSTASLVACDTPSGYVAGGSVFDCNDRDAAVGPGSVESCNGKDDNCDGVIDDATSSDATAWYADVDGDAYGDATSTTRACTKPAGWVTDTSDCDDTSAAVHPGVSETCDDVDQDCDGAVDESATDMATWYRDADADAYGLASSTTKACDAPSGYAAVSGDCDDADASAYPGATEICDDADDDCDGSIDEAATDMDVWYRDRDADGYGDALTTRTACDAPTGYVADATDCNDASASAWPGATETCDGLDNDCDGSTDEGVKSTWYLDADGDGYGTTATAVSACTAPTSKYVSASGDCDDREAAFHPGATEGCDGSDYDCDGDVDNDLDGDTYAAATCGGDDCDDTNASIKPEIDGGCAMGANCLDVLASGHAAGDDVYLIDPDGWGTGADPFEVLCDMTTDGGGWTNITGDLLQDQGWMAFAWINGPSGTSSSTYWQGAWYGAGRFWLNPLWGSTCDTMALRATATLPFTFTEWFGAWSGTGATTSTNQDDTRVLGWTEVTNDCNGTLKFGTDLDISKAGSEWGVHWNGSYCPSCTAYWQTWSWSQTTVTETDEIRWQVVDQGTGEDVVFYDVDFWVR